MPVPPNDSLRRVKIVASVLDDAIRVPGTDLRFGIDPLVGLVPGLGDLLGGAASAYIILEAARAGAPASVLTRMALNVGIDTLVGGIPVLGDLFDFAWKATEWNMALLERHAMPGRPATSFDYLFVILCVLVVAVAALLPLLLVWAGVSWLRAALSHP